MIWYQYLSLGALAVFLIAMLWHFIRLIKEGKPKDLSTKSGNLPKAEVYAYTIAMMPNHKESAYLHLPSFTAGIFFHIGIFLSILLFFLFFFISPTLFPQWLQMVLALCIGICGLCGFGLFIKRMIVKKMRELSHLDDFLSNFFTTLFQFFTAIYLIAGSFAPIYYILVTILLLYIPMGKLKHMLYFFAARFHLGYFYGWRNSWPPQKNY